MNKKPEEIYEAFVKYSYECIKDIMKEYEVNFNDAFKIYVDNILTEL